MKLTSTNKSLGLTVKFTDEQQALARLACGLHYSILKALRAFKSSFKFSGGFVERVTPVPIPNTEVKPLGADGTAREAAWESRTPPDYSTDDKPARSSLTLSGLSFFRPLLREYPSKALPQ